MMRFGKEINIVFSYIKKFKVLVCLNVLVLLGTSLFEGLGIGMIVPILQTMSGESSTNFFTRYGKSLCQLLGIEYSFINLMVIFAIIMLTKYALVAIQQYTTRLLSASVTYELREKAFQNLMALPLGYYYKTKLGDIVATLYTSSNNSGGLMECAVLMFTSLVFCLAYIAINCLISIPLTVIACLLTLFSYFFIIPKFRMGFTQGKEEKTIIDKMSSFLFDKLGGIKILKSFNNEYFHIGEFKQLNSSFKRVAIKIQNNRILAGLCLEPLIFLLIIILLIFSVEVLHMRLVLLITFFYVFNRLIPQVKSVNTNYLQAMELLPHLSRIQDIIERENKIYLTDGSRRIKSVEFKIEFNNVWFKYPGSKEYVLKNITMVTEKNKTTALVGPSGGGKTTLVDLILRHHDPEKGSIKVDGVDLREIKRSDWHQIVSVVDQDPYLFNDTIYNNILYGKLDARKEDVINATKLANAHNFICMLPAKYDTLVGERGIKLSGGQKQRISLARALIRDPEILILDEATSALDSESERLIQDSIEKFSRSKTIIIIAHRISTIIKADKIIIIENGEVAEEGSHKKLLEKKGIYKRYYSLQYQIH